MRERRRHLVGFSLAALLLLLALPAGAGAATGLDDAVPSLASPTQKPFVGPRARPTDGADPYHNDYRFPEARRSPACGPNFCVHWVARGIDAPNLADADADQLPDFVEQVLRIAEYVHLVENVQLGWREPKGDGRLGGGVDKTDIYLSQIGGQLFGYAAPDRGQFTKRRQPQRRLHGYLVLDNDYSAFEFPGTKPSQDLEVTLAHEYNHILQFGYDAFQDPWFAESTAVWMEDQVFGEIDDYLRYVRRWVGRWSVPLTANSIKEYGSAVWNDWLAQRYGPEIVRRTWAQALRARPGGFAIAAYDAAIRAAGPSDFGRDFTRFAAAVAEWGTGVGFHESGLYPRAHRQGRLAANGRPVLRRLNHTTFSLLGVRVRGGRGLTVSVRVPRGVAAGLALVGRSGDERGGASLSSFDYSRNGGKLRVHLAEPGRFGRITAVLVNADASVGSFRPRAFDWRYLTDDVPFEVRAVVAR